MRETVVVDKRTLLLAETDLVMYADGAPEAVRAMFVGAYRVAEAKAAAAGLEYVDADGEIHPRRWRLTFGEDQEDIRAKQRGFLHVAVFPQIADQVRVMGERYVAKVWKEFYRKLFLPDQWEMRADLKWDPEQRVMVPAKRKTPHRVRVSTEDLGSVKAYSDYIDRVIAHAVTEFGVAFNFDRQEREAVRWKAKKRKAKQREEAASAC